MEIMKILSIVILLLFVQCSNKRKIYYDDGNIYSETEMNNGFRNGKSIIYYPSGQVKGIKYLQNDTINGKSIYYYENGIIEAEENHEMGKPSGDNKYYYSNGNLKMIDTYILGSIIKTRKYNNDGELVFDDLKSRVTREYRKFKVGEKIWLKVEFKNYIFDKRDVIAGDGYCPLDSNQVYIKDTLVHKSSNTNQIDFYIIAKKPGLNRLYGNYRDISSDTSKYGTGWFIEEYFVE